MITVYRLMCLANNKNYIGVTSDLAYRLISHFRSRSHTLLARAIRKHGKDNFQVFVLEEVSTWEEAWAKEKYYIRVYDSYRVNGYNMTLGGEGQSGLVHSEKTRKQMSESHKGKGIGPDNSMYGKPGSRLGKRMSEESRLKLSASCKGRIPWNKGKKCPQLSGENNGFYNGVFSPAILRRITRAGWKHSEETKQRLSVIHSTRKRKPHTKEARRNMSIAARNRKQINVLEVRQTWQE